MYRSLNAVRTQVKKRRVWEMGNRKCPYKSDSKGIFWNCIEIIEFNCILFFVVSIYVVVACSCSFELSRSIHSKWAVIELCHYCVQWATSSMTNKGVWSIGAKYLKGENQITWKKAVPVFPSLPRIPHGPSSCRARASVVTDRRLNTSSMTR